MNRRNLLLALPALGLTSCNWMLPHLREHVSIKRDVLEKLILDELERLYPSFERSATITVTSSSYRGSVSNRMDVVATLKKDGVSIARRFTTETLTLVATHLMMINSSNHTLDTVWFVSISDDAYTFMVQYEERV